MIVVTEIVLAAPISYRNRPNTRLFRIYNAIWAMHWLSGKWGGAQVDAELADDRMGSRRQI
jgi:hypothetical protein